MKIRFCFACFFISRNLNQTAHFPPGVFISWPQKSQLFLWGGWGRGGGYITSKLASQYEYLSRGIYKRMPQPLFGAKTSVIFAYIEAKARVRGGLAKWQLPFWRGAGREPRKENFWATTLWNSFFVTMLMCHV